MMDFDKASLSYAPKKKTKSEGDSANTAETGDHSSSRT